MTDPCTQHSRYVKGLDLAWYNPRREFQFTLIWLLAVASRLHNSRQHTDNGKRQLLESIAYGTSTVPWCITDEYIQEVRKNVDAYREELVVKMISDQITDYERSVIKFIENLDNMMSDVIRKPNSISQIIGIARSLPNSIEFARVRNDFESFLDDIRPRAEFFGEVGKRVNCVMRLVSKRYLKNKGFYVVNGLVNDSHLLVYFDTRPELEAVNLGDEIKIRATITGHQVSNFTKCKETRISRVAYA